MSRWFRVYDDMVDDPKVQRLAPPLFKALVNLWCLASQNAGNLPSMDAIAFKLRTSVEKTQKILEKLRDAGLLDGDESDSRPHNWDSRQFKSDQSNERVKRYRERQRNVTPIVTQAVTETPPETETEYRDREQKVRKKDAASAAPLFENGSTSNGHQPPGDEKSQFYARARAILGASSGGLATKLLTAKEGSVPLARAAIEMASTKGPAAREYIGAIIRSAGAPIEQHHDPRL